MGAAEELWRTRLAHMLALCETEIQLLWDFLAHHPRDNKRYRQLSHCKITNGIAIFFLLCSVSSFVICTDAEYRSQLVQLEPEPTRVSWGICELQPDSPRTMETHLHTWPESTIDMARSACGIKFQSGFDRWQKLIKVSPNEGTGDRIFDGNGTSEQLICKR